MRKMLSLVILSTLLTPREGLGGTPAPDAFGKVLDASTDKPVVGVRIVAIDAGDRTERIGPRVIEAVTDSLGKYALSLWGQAWVLYTTPDYEPLRLVYPEELVERDCDSCCDRMKDVKLQRWHR